MAYNPDDYVIDFANGFDPDAALNDGAILYRVTSRTYSGPTEILTGNGAALGRNEGRFHVVQQRATYCANNIIVCISEMLYHLYRAMLDGIRDELPPADLKKRDSQKRALVIFSVSAIDELVYADSVGARRYSRSITGPSITCPDAVYAPLQKFSNEVRLDSKNGLVFPSARHTEGFAFALFRDETASLKPNPYVILELQLQLISESQDLTVKPPAKFDIERQKLHPTVGYYEFLDPIAFNDAKIRQLVHPDGLPCQGYVDFVRRRYDKTKYPVTAHWPC